MAGSSKVFQLAFAIGGKLSPDFNNAVGEAADAIKKLNKESQEAAKSNKAASDIGKMFSGLGKEASGVGQAWGNVGSAIAGPLQTIAKFGALAAGAGASIFALTAKTAAMGDSAVKTAKKIGLTTEAYSSMAYAAEQNGVSSQTFSNSMIKLNKNIAGAVEGNKSAKLAFERAGVSIYDSNGKLKDSNQILLEASNMFAKMPDGIYKADLAMALFGKSGAEMVPLMEQGSEEINKLRRDAERLGITFDDEAGAKATAFSSSIAEAKGAIQGLGISVTQQLYGPLTDITSQFTKWIVANREWISLKAAEFIEEFKNHLPEIKAFLIDAANGVKSFATTINDIAQAFGGWDSVIKNVAKAWGVLNVIKIGFAIGSAAVKTASFAKSIMAVVPVIKGIALAVAGVSAPVLGVVAAVAAAVAIGVLLYKNWDAIKEKAGEVWDYIVGAVSGAWDSIVGIWGGIVGFFTEKIDNIKAAFSDGFLNGIGQIFKEFNLASLANDMINKVFGIDLLGIGKSWMQKFIDGIVGAVSGAADLVKEAVGNLIPSPVKSIVSGAKNAIGSIMPFAEGGIVNGPQLAMVGEAGPEAIVPLSNPARAAEIIQQISPKQQPAQQTAASPIEQLSKASNCNNSDNSKTSNATFNFSPNITVSGGDFANIEAKINSALNNAKDSFEKWFREREHDMARVAMV